MMAGRSAMLVVLFGLIALCGPASLAAGEEIHTKHGLGAGACEEKDCAIGGEFVGGQPTKCYLRGGATSKGVPAAGSAQVVDVVCPTEYICGKNCDEYCVFNAMKYGNGYLIVGTEYKKEGQIDPPDATDGIPECTYLTISTVEKHGQLHAKY
ncbi:unnamed protein product [Vitrella brassicaformis CCMP3155]|uniref:Uncharacterized protein n=1 Tax=Vitrella brassicaformis (strain CCMP3155) TaxID=1169540 RepID=A0A0G4GIS7_VITBC|nr:unnamed protein product [Vitrella brassicaformis CCMP3155]|eukprot:CEM29746.1 unnamed protein product [Vitrella brassicaformis CCMP3155]